MSNASVSRLGLLLSPLNLFFTWLIACALLALPALADSQARIVRLSDVQGSVQIDKNSGLGFENAFLNLPITQGAQLRTGDNGRAEIEFEDGSTVRLAPNTSVEFSTLGVNDSGKHISILNLDEGMAYVNWLGKGGDQISLNFSREQIAIDRAAHFRVETSSEGAKVAVFKGEVDVDGPSGKVAVEKKTTANFDAADDDKYALASKVEQFPLDSWDKEAIAYHDQNFESKNNSSPYGYGVSDLNYYGAYSNVPGLGMMWQPYFTGVGWNPFMDGNWSWYPGYGYMFASAYPWGWMPYRYGNWMFVPAFGWMWQPGGFNSWAATPRFAGTLPAGFHPLLAPAGGSVKSIAVGRGGTESTLVPSRLVVNAGSAGLGVPRGIVSNLSHINRQVAKSGFAEVHPAPQFGSGSSHAPVFGSPQGGFTSSSIGHTSSSGHSSGGGAHH